GEGRGHTRRPRRRGRTAGEDLSDKDHTFVNVIKALGAGHQTVVHSAKEFVRGEVHSNTADGIGSLLERARMGVWHRMSRLHLQRYLDEIGCRTLGHRLRTPRQWVR